MKHFLTVIVPEKKAVKYALKGERITIGRAEDNAIPLKVSAVSSHHLEIRKTESGYRILDLDSTNGTTVNGERIQEHHLADGDDLVIGTAIRAQYAAVADESTAATAPAQPLQPNVVVPSAKPASPTLVLKKAQPQAAKAPSEPIDPPTDIRIRKMTPPGVEAPVEHPSPAAPPAQSDSASDEPEAAKTPDDPETPPRAPKLKLPNPGRTGSPRKLNLG